MLRGIRSVLLVCLAGPLLVLAQNPPVVTLPTVGTIQGRVKQTIGNLGNTPKNFYNFRNIPFGNSVSGDARFSQPTKFTGQLGTEASPYDASMSGPLCPQLGLDPSTVSANMDQTMEEWANAILTEHNLDGIIPPDSLLRILEDFLEVPVEGETWGSLLEELLDENISVDEDCLNLAVSTPTLPSRDGTKQTGLLPVMFFIYGGGFIAGTQYRMGMERFGEVNDFVIVSTNYRLGPLGFMCVDTDDAAGNMGLLDQILALEWVQENIEYFGGDPTQVTIMGQSAGSVSVSLLQLSPLADGLFHRAIMESGSAVCPWAYDTFAPDWHAHRIANKLGCTQADDQAMVDCMKTKTVVEINEAARQYSAEEMLRGTLGFGGTNPCGQTAGAKKVFQHGDMPERILSSGNYNSVPVLGGSNRDEGLIAWAPLYGMLNDTMKNDYDFVRYDLTNFLLQTVGLTYGFSFSDIVAKEYWTDAELGDFDAMQDGMIDLAGMLVLKAPSYKMIEENSKRQDSYYYFLEKRGRKTFHRIFSELENPDLPKPTWGNEMAAHADELLYLFDVPIPLYLCDLAEFFAALGVEWNACVDSVGLLHAEECVTDPAGAFKAEWMECIDGHLTNDEQLLSDIMVKFFSNFIIYGNPTPSGSGLPVTLPKWSNADPKYIVFNDVVSLRTNYRDAWASKSSL